MNTASVVNSSPIGIFSEIAPLKKVLVHSPGLEVEHMDPRHLKDMLFNDLAHYSLIQEGHRQLVSVLSSFCQTLEVSQLLEETLEDGEIRQSFIREMCERESVTQLLNGLLNLPVKYLVKCLIQGLSHRPQNLKEFIENHHFSLKPLPNLFFMRDSAVVFQDRVILSRMANPVRQRESWIMHTLFAHHPQLKNQGFWYNNSPFSLEGGDFVILSKNIICVGLSQRTSVEALDALLLRWQSHVKDGEPFHVFAISLPDGPSTIHLDMVFTAIDTHSAVVYEPIICGRHRGAVYHALIEGPGKPIVFKEEKSLLEGLGAIGHGMEPILCGLGDSLYGAREQWHSGANFFTLAPGKTISYGFNQKTLEACVRSGFHIVGANKVIANPKLLHDSHKVVVTLDGAELARGGGGPRCMTCPLLREV